MFYLDHQTFSHLHEVFSPFNITEDIV